MTRVLMATQGWGVHLDPAGNVRAGATASIANLDATAATHYSAKTGGTSSTGAMTTDTNGYLQRWIAVGSYTLTDTYSIAYPVEAVNGADLAASSGAFSDASTTVKGVTQLSVAPASSTIPIAAGTNDSRLSDARTPLSHTHVATTDLTATGTKNTTTFLRGDNTWAVPPSAAAGKLAPADFALGSVTGTQTVNFTSDVYSAEIRLTLTGNVTLNLTNVPTTARISIRRAQAATGGPFTVTVQQDGVTGTVMWDSGGAYSSGSTAAGSVDRIAGVKAATNLELGVAGSNYS